MARNPCRVGRRASARRVGSREERERKKNPTKRQATHLPGLLRERMSSLPGTGGGGGGGSLKSEEVNFLIYRYLQESGFSHAAFTFGAESLVHRSGINPLDVPPGALISFIQKGIQYLEIEANLADEEGNDVVYKSPLELLTPDHMHRVQKEPPPPPLPVHPVPLSTPVNGTAPFERPTSATYPPSSQLFSQTTASSLPIQAPPIPKSASSGPGVPAAGKPSVLIPMSDSGAGAAEREAPAMVAGPAVAESDVRILRGHSKEVFVCVFNPRLDNLLATASGDGSARIWNLGSGDCAVLPHAGRSEIAVPPAAANAGAGVGASAAATDGTSSQTQQHKDVTTLDWSPDGNFIASGSYDGIARIWGRDGQEVAALSGHKGPIFVVGWNRDGDYLLSGSVDRNVIIWSMADGSINQQFSFHTHPVLDADWRDNTCFASCSTDQKIYVCELGQSQPLRCFWGHKDEVNCIRWDTTGRLLASCSDDGTAKIWSLEASGNGCVWDFRDHSKEVYAVRWSPAASASHILATSSFDTSVRIWDCQIGRCLQRLCGHTEPVYSVAWSPDGEYIASGSIDHKVHVWNVRDGQIVRTYSGSSGMFDMSWNRTGDKLAAGFSNSTVAVIDLRK